MNKVLAVLGDAWHAPSVINQVISPIFENKGYAIDRVINCDVPFQHLDDYEIVILFRYAIDDLYNYTHNQGNEKKPWISEIQESKFEEYVRKGGKLFLFHDGIGYYKKDQSICRLAKAFCLGHPPITKITVRPVNESINSVLVERIEPFEISDEEFNLEMDETQTNVFAESFSKENGRHVQGWHHSYMNGKVIVFVPGHDSTVLRQPMVRIFLDNIANWLTE